MKENNIKEQFIDLRAKGTSYSKIAGKLNVSKKTLITWGKEFRTEIHNLKGIEIEALREKYHLNNELRLEIFGKMLDNIRKELDKRDLSGIPTVKLLVIFIKYLNYARTEDFDLYFKFRQGFNEIDLGNSMNGNQNYTKITP